MMNAEGMRLRKARKDAKLTQIQLGKICNISQVAISLYEDGKRTIDYNLLDAAKDVIDLDFVKNGEIDDGLKKYTLLIPKGMKVALLRVEV